MKRISEDYIALTNREARDIQIALNAASELASQFAVELRAYGIDSKAKEVIRVMKRLDSWSKRIHRVWSYFRGG